MYVWKKTIFRRVKSKAFAMKTKMKTYFMLHIVSMSVYILCSFNLLEIREHLLGKL